ncbi:MAG: ABC transporter substrate-binding protein [Betaproteobacteria bacterium]
MINRRNMVIALGVGALAPLVSFAQPGRVWRVGFLVQRHLDFVASDFIYGPFTQGMSELGYVTGKNLLIEWRSAEGKAERLPELAAELVRLKVDVLTTSGTVSARAAQKATLAIPIVMANLGDPVGTGLVKTLARPGGNSTALSNMNNELGPKLLELLLSTAPKAGRVAVLVNPSNASSTALLKTIQTAAAPRGVRILSLEASTPAEIAGAFAALTRQNAGALIVLREAFFSQQKTQIVELATKHRLPSIGGYREYVEAGGLMSYGNDIRDSFRRAATYVDKILKGAKPGDLPVEQPTKFELFVNLKTARALGVKIPPSILIRADKVIE